MNGYKISEVAQLAGMPIDTIRYYERVGLIAAPPRTTSGYRLYPTATLERLQMVRRAKDLGFSLSEIGELLDMLEHRDVPCRELHCRLVSKIEELEGRIGELDRVRNELQALRSACAPNTPIHSCPVLATLVPTGKIADLLYSPGKDD